MWNNAKFHPGALGEMAELVERGLQKLFRLAQAWDCILLLDEADVFLAERTLQDINRNGIVSGRRSAANYIDNFANDYLQSFSGLWNTMRAYLS
jgi:hypothetical protein